MCKPVSESFFPSFDDVDLGQRDLFGRTVVWLFFTGFSFGNVSLVSGVVLPFREGSFVSSTSSSPLSLSSSAASKRGQLCGSSSQSPPLGTLPLSEVWLCPLGKTVLSPPLLHLHCHCLPLLLQREGVPIYT